MQPLVGGVLPGGVVSPRDREERAASGGGARGGGLRGLRLDGEFNQT